MLASLLPLREIATAPLPVPRPQVVIWVHIIEAPIPEPLADAIAPLDVLRIVGVDGAPPTGGDGDHQQALGVDLLEQLGVVHSVVPDDSTGPRVARAAVAPENIRPIRTCARRRNSAAPRNG